MLKPFMVIRALIGAQPAMWTASCGDLLARRTASYAFNTEFSKKMSGEQNTKKIYDTHEAMSRHGRKILKLTEWKAGVGEGSMSFKGTDV